MRITIFTLTLLVAAMAVPATAWSSVRFCNQSATRVSVAIAYVQKDAPGTSTGGHLGATVKGWYKFEPGECASVSDIHAGQHWVYYYAHTTDGGTSWGGNSMLCVSNRSFADSQPFKRPNDACPGGARLEGFKRMETNAPNHTVTLH